MYLYNINGNEDSMLLDSYVMYV